jgi:hypothetical protein
MGPFHLRKLLAFYQILYYNFFVEYKKASTGDKLSTKQLIALRHKGTLDPIMTCECRLCGVILTRISDTCQGLYPYVGVRVQTFVFQLTIPQ